MFLRGILSSLDSEPVRDAMRNFRKPGPGVPADPEELEHAVSQALEEDPDTNSLAVRVESLGDGIVELIGTAPDALSRQIAADIARAVPGADIVVNRILVEGGDGGTAVSQPGPDIG
jgi:osmotically-inducible protein OsmY